MNFVEQDTSNNLRGLMTQSDRFPVRPFFIMGCPRSGTTLLRWMLDSHAEIAVMPETHFGERYVKRHRDSRIRRGRHGGVGERAKVGREGILTRGLAGEASRGSVQAAEGSRDWLLEQFCASSAFYQMSIDEGRFRDRAHTQRMSKDPWNLLRIAMAELGAIQKATIVGEKTPSHALYLSEMASAFPDAQFLFLVRDPRAVAVSWRAASWSRHSVAEIAENWRRYRQAMFEASDCFGARCLEVRYEELVTDPRSTLQSISQFLGIGFDPRMLCYADRSKQGASPEERLDQALIFESPDPARAEAWRREISPGDQSCVEAICARSMLRSGFALESSSRQRALASLRVLPSLWPKRLKRWRGKRRRNSALAADD